MPAPWIAATARTWTRLALSFGLIVGLAGLSANAVLAQQPGPDARIEPIGPAAMSLGLAGVVDWSVQQPFIDVMKTARPWIGHLPGQWGGRTEADLIADGVLDADGWPMRIPPDLHSIGTVILTDLPEAALSLAGRYRLSFDGDGIVEISGRATNVRYAPGQVQFDFTPGPGPVTVAINRTDRNRKGDYVRNISVVKTDLTDRHEAGEIFNPDWIARIDPFGTVRFMDWMDTNGSEIVHWSDRPHPTAYSYARNGVPVEILVALANRTGADPWFNMPHRATDAFMARFAGYVRDTLDPRLTAYVEYSNEVWNWQFPQAVWAEEAAAARWGVEHGWMQYYGLRTAEMAKIWKKTYGDAAADRLVTVISTQTGWFGLEHDALEAPLWTDEDAAIAAPAKWVDAYAIAGYFGRVLGTPEKAATVHGWIDRSLRDAEGRANALDLTGPARAAFLSAHRFDAAIAIAAQELADGSITGDASDTLAELIGTTFPYHAEIARRHGLDLIMYEGGSHIAGVAEIVDDDALTEFFVALNYAPEMGGLYTELLAGWWDSGGALFNVFVDVLQPGKWGSWGALRYLTDNNPRWDAIVGFR